MSKKLRIYLNNIDINQVGFRYLTDAPNVEHQFNGAQRTLRGGGKCYEESLTGDLESVFYHVSSSKRESLIRPSFDFANIRVMVEDNGSDAMVYSSFHLDKDITRVAFNIFNNAIRLHLDIVEEISKLFLDAILPPAPHSIVALELQDGDH